MAPASFFSPPDRWKFRCLMSGFLSTAATPLPGQIFNSPRHSLDMRCAREGGGDFGRSRVADDGSFFRAPDQNFLLLPYNRLPLDLRSTSNRADFVFFHPRLKTHCARGGATRRPVGAGSLFSLYMGKKEEKIKIKI